MSAAIGAGVPLVIGTTGLEDKHHRAIDDAARAVAGVAKDAGDEVGLLVKAALKELAK